MSNVRILGRGAKTTDELMILLGDRGYGAFMDPSERLDQALPVFFDPIIAEFRDSSKLLALDPADNPDPDAIFDAYKADVRFLQARLDGFELMARCAVEASMKSDNSDPGKMAKSWDRIKEQMPAMANVQLIDLGADRAALPAPQLLAELKAEVETGIDRMLRRVCLWLDELVDLNYAGLVNFTAPTVGHYYYFRPCVTEEEIDRKDELTSTYDETQQYGSRTTYRHEQSRTVRVTENLERHDHHIVRAQVNRVGEFQHPIPNRIIRNFLERMPTWLMPHLRIVSGDITKEEIRSRVVGSHDESDRVVSVWKDSPAITLGPYALIGWSGDDIENESSSFWRGRTIPQWEILKRWRTRALLFMLAFGLVWGGYSLMSMLARSISASARAEYHAYYKAHAPGHRIFKVQANHQTTLPNGETFWYLGSRNNARPEPTFATKADATGYVGDDNNWMVVDDRAPNNSDWVITNASSGMPAFGTTTLNRIGIPAKINILAVDDNQVTFTLDYLGDAAKK